MPKYTSNLEITNTEPRDTLYAAKIKLYIRVEALGEGGGVGIGDVEPSTKLKT